MKFFEYRPGKVRQNPSGEENLETEYQLTKDPVILHQLNNYLISIGKTPVDIDQDPVNFKEFLRKSFDALDSEEFEELFSEIKLVNGLLFSAYQIKSKPGARLREIATVFQKLGYVGLLVLQMPDRRTSHEERQIPDLNTATNVDLYLVTKKILKPSGDPISRSVTNEGTLIADCWRRYEDPRTLTEPSRRRGSYPVKIVLVQKPGHRMIGGQLTRTTDNYTTWQYIIPYEPHREGQPVGIGNGFIAHGHYDMSLRDGQIDYILRVLARSIDNGVFDLII